MHPSNNCTFFYTSQTFFCTYPNITCCIWMYAGVRLGSQKILSNCSCLISSPFWYRNLLNYISLFIAYLQRLQIALHQQFDCILFFLVPAVFRCQTSQVLTFFLYINFPSHVKMLYLSRRCRCSRECFFFFILCGITQSMCGQCSVIF